MECCGLLVKTYATVHPAPSPRLCPLSYPWKPRGAQAGRRSLSEHVAAAGGRDPRMTWSWTPAHTTAALTWPGLLSPAQRAFRVYLGWEEMQPRGALIGNLTSRVFGYSQANSRPNSINSGLRFRV